MRRRIPSTQSLTCFEAAARHQSFTRAAQELALTQGGVSRQVALLEEQLGVALFRRGRYGMTLTTAGRDYASQVAQRLTALELDTLDLMGRRGEGSSATLGCGATLAARWLVPRLPQLASEHPGLQIHLEARSRPFSFGDTGIDAAIFAGTSQQAEQWPGTRAAFLFAEEVLPVCGPALLKGRPSLQPHDIATMPLLQTSTRPDAWRKWFDAQGVDCDQAMAGPRYQLFSMQSAAAQCLMGIALIPPLLIDEELRSGRLVAACDRPMRGERNYYFVQPDLPEKAAVTDLREWLHRRVAADRRLPASPAALAE